MECVKHPRLSPWRAALLSGLLLLPASGAAAASRSEAVVAGAGGVKIHTAARGPAAAPAIVLVHGLMGDHTTWDSLSGRELEQQYRLIVMDLRGHGVSGRPRDPSAYEGDVWAQDLRAVLDHYGPERPVLLGWSFGGRVVLDYLRLYGEGGVSGVVLVAASAGGGPRRTSGTRESAAAPGWVVSAIRSGKRRDHASTLEKITVPVLILQGSRDRVVPPSRADHIEDHTANGTKLVFEGVGHEVHLELGERFARILLEFADGLSGAAP